MKKDNEKEPQFQIKYLLNSAVLIQYGKDKILVDGILSNHQMFDVYDARTQNDIWERKNEFEGLNYLVFTHCHNDHYGRKNVCRFLELNPDVTVLIPSNHRISENFINKAQQEKNARFCIMCDETGQVRRYDFGEFQIEFMKTEHTTFRYPEHYCVNIVSPFENVVLTADMEFNKIQLLQKFTKRAHATIFINHLALLHRAWRNELLALEYNQIYFYHLPTAERDYYQYRPRTMRNWEKYKKDFPMGTLLDYCPSK